MVERFELTASHEVRWTLSRPSHRDTIDYYAGRLQPEAQLRQMSSNEDLIMMK